MQAEPDQGMAVGSEVVGVGNAVFFHVRTVGVGGIGPPVITFGEIVVGTAGAAHRLVGRQGYRRLVKVLVGGTKNAAAFVVVETERELAACGGGSWGACGGTDRARGARSWAACRGVARGRRACRDAASPCDTHHR